MTEEVPAPNETARDTSFGLAIALLYYRLHPTRIDPLAEGGIGMTFKRGDRTATLECYNDGDVCVVVSDRRNDQVAWEIDPKDTAAGLERMVAFLQETP